MRSEVAVHEAVDAPPSLLKVELGRFVDDPPGLWGRHCFVLTHESDHG